ncbi:MAG: hypothetical protein ABTR92_17345, partial [Candidatus Accumulibacter phosphatis]
MRDRCAPAARKGREPLGEPPVAALCLVGELALSRPQLVEISPIMKVMTVSLFPCPFSRKG